MVCLIHFNVTPMKKFIQILLLAIMLYSCKDPLGVEENVRITPILKPKKLDLSNIQLGQRAKFTFFEISNGSYLSSDTKRLFQGDTLILEVFGRDKGDWLFREFVVRHLDTLEVILKSDMLSDTLADTVVYRVNISNNVFTAVMPGSNIFNSYLFKSTGIVSFSLDDYTDTLVNMNMWGSPFYFSQAYKKGYLVNFVHKQKTYDRINIIEMGDNTKDIASEIPLQLQIFSKKYGLVQRIMFYSSQTFRETIGYGWDLVSE
jgi:hypothetical protein